MSETPNPPQPSPPPDSAETDFARMERELKEQLDQADKNPRDALWQLARLYNATKRHDQALECLRRILASESDLEVKAGCVLALGQTMEQCNNFPAAISFYREALTMEPMADRTWYLIHNNLGYCHNQIGRFDEGEKFCRLAIQINPCRPNGYKNLGIALVAQGNYREAANSYITGTLTYPGDMRSFKLLQELVKEHPDLTFDFQNQIDRCAKSISFATLAIERALSGRPFKVLLASAVLEWLNLCGYVLQAVCGGAVEIHVVENLSKFIDEATSGDFDLGFFGPGGFPLGSPAGRATDSWEEAVRAIRQIKSQKPIALVLVATADELTRHDAAAQASGADAILKADHQTDALVETTIHLLMQHNPATSNP
jgi:tetratricopeptide (TPR) repeat protein